MNNPIYNTIGTNYNNTRQADPYLTERLISLLNVPRGSSVLDIGCGTGNYTTELHRRGLILTGVDPSEKMLEEANKHPEEISWLKGSAENIPVADLSFDGIVGTLTLHHWKDFITSFKELYRVLKPGGKAVFFTSTPGQMQGYWLNHYFPMMLRASIIQMPSETTILDAATGAGFIKDGTEKYFVANNLSDHFLYVGKNRPELYFRDEIRKGISSFSALANQEEVTSGLEKLRKDIDNGDHDRVKLKYENIQGDYLFIVLKKPR